MKKILLILVLLSTMALYGSITYNPDGTVTIISARNKKTISMEGKTVYGKPIREQRRMLKRKSFYVEVIYSSLFSDMPLRLEGKSNFVERFYRELVKQCDRWMQSHRVPKGKMTIVLSNCRFSKTGFCRRKNKNELRLYTYMNGKKGKELSLRHSDLISMESSLEKARTTASEIFTRD